MPSPDLLYTQNERVEEGTVENRVSSRTVSVENVSDSDGDVPKVSSSQEMTAATANDMHKVYNKCLNDFIYAL